MGEDFLSEGQFNIEVMEKEYNPDLKNHVISNFTWEHTAQQTLEGYKLAIQLHQE